MLALAVKATSDNPRMYLRSFLVSFSSFPAESSRRAAKPVARALVGRGFLVGTATDPRVIRLAPPAVTPLYAVDQLADALREVLPAARVAHAAA